jgi:hypothetical protein
MMAYPSAVPPAFTDYPCDHLIVRVGRDTPFFYIIQDSTVIELDDVEAIVTLQSACTAFLELHRQTLPTVEAPVS